MPQAVNLQAKLALFNDHYAPRTIATFNGHDLMVVRAHGALDWHEHPDTDDFFLVLEGKLRLETEHGNVELGTGDLYVVPRGVVHRTRAPHRTVILMVEGAGIVPTGD